jgi:hypothetical protein
MQVDGTTAFGGGLVLGGGATALAATPVSNRIYRHEFGKWRDVIDATPNLTRQDLAGKMLQFDREIGLPLVTAKRVAIGAGIGAVVLGGVLLGVHLLGGDD